MTVLRTYHQRNISQIDWKTIYVVVYLSCDLSQKRSTICLARQPTFLRIYLMMNDTGVSKSIGLTNFKLWKGNFDIVERCADALVMLMNNITLMQFHRGEVVKYRVETTLQHEVERLDVVGSSQWQLERLLLIHYYKWYSLYL